jgi:DNA-directed RNA polymerase specialized sigma subunit
MSRPYAKRYYRSMTPAKAQRIREMYFSERVKQTEIARVFGIAQGNVSRIVSGSTWA